jgi:hypothetical protein
MANIVASVIATFNGKALTKGKKEISSFDKTVKKLGKTFATTFGAYQLLAFSKKAVAAFAADEKAAKSLEVQLKNTGFAFSAPGVEAYIGSLQKLYGVLDDELRPAFQQLLTATGSITKSQDALETALNVSAATGRSLSEVSAALTRGFSGNTTGLTRLGAGLSKATLKTGDMNKIMEELNTKFAGQATARLTTYAGKMDLLKVASENVKEEIGKGILGALDALGKDTNIKDTTKKMEALGKQTGYTITGLGVLIAKLGDIPGIGLIGKAFYETSALGLLARLGKENTPARELPANEQRSAGRIDAKRFQTEDKLAKAKAAELALLLKKNAIENKNVEELRKKFDLERIGLNAALNSATDEETKLRLKAQLAILDNNDALAKKLLAEMEAAEALKKLADAANKAADALDKNMNKYDAMIASLITQFTALGLSLQESMALAAMSARYQAQADALLVGKGPVKGAAPSAGPTFTPLTASYFQDLATQLVGTPSYAGMNVSQIATERARESGNRSVDVNVRIDTPSGDKFAQLVAESIQVAGRSGYSTAPNGGLPG